MTTLTNNNNGNMSILLQSTVGMGSSTRSIRSSGSGGHPRSPRNKPPGSPLNSPARTAESGGKKYVPPVAPLNLEDMDDQQQQQQQKTIWDEQEKPIKGARRLGSAWKREMMGGLSSPRVISGEGHAMNNSGAIGGGGGRDSPRLSNAIVMGRTSGVGGGGGAQRRTSFFRSNLPPTIQDGVSPSPHWDQDREARRMQRLEIQRVIANLPRFAAMARSKNPDRLNEALKETESKLWHDWEVGATEIVHLRFVGRIFYLWRAATIKSIQRKKEILLDLKLAELSKKGGVPTRVRSFQNFGGSKMKKTPSFVMTQDLKVNTKQQDDDSQLSSSVDVRKLLGGENNQGLIKPPTTPIINDLPIVGFSLPTTTATSNNDGESDGTLSPPPTNLSPIPITSATTTTTSRTTSSGGNGTTERERPKSKFFSFGVPRVLSRRMNPINNNNNNT
jgi:hypothetical protein